MALLFEAYYMFTITHACHTNIGIKRIEVHSSLTKVTVILALTHLSWCRNASAISFMN